MCRAIRDRRANPDRRDSPVVIRDPPASRAILDQQESPASRGSLVPPANQGSPDLRDRQANQASPDRRANLDPPANQASLERRARPAPQARPT